MKTTGLQRVINCLKAEKRATEPSFQNFWKNTAQNLAQKNNIDIADVKENLELYDAGEIKVKAGSFH
tara:strand:- start:141 stop:341 length:201 start_codon:yes stop_codon:yes gene_type:complete